MWWEVLPPAIIMCICWATPDLVCYANHRFFFKTPYKRSDLTQYEVSEILRDERLTGEKKIWRRTKYHFVGLEGIPDEPEAPQQQKKPEC